MRKLSLREGKGLVQLPTAQTPGLEFRLPVSKLEVFHHYNWHHLQLKGRSTPIQESFVFVTLPGAQAGGVGGGSWATTASYIPGANPAKGGSPGL